MSPPRALSLAFAVAAALGAVYAGEVQPAQPAPSRGAESAPEASGAADAERHARRTACLKDARARKLVGAQRSAYVKDCVDNSPQAR